MGRRALLSLLILSFIGTTAYAGGAGNCVQPIRTTTKHWGLGGTFGYNYMDRRMNDLNNRRGMRNMRVEKLNQIYGGGIIGIGDYVNLYGRAGGQNYDLEFDAGPESWRIKADLEDGIYTGVGITGFIPIGDIKPVSFGIGIGVQGNFGLNKVKELEVRSVTAKSAGGTFYEVDGQNSLYLTCKYDIKQFKTSIVPYIGGYHSWMVIGTITALTFETTATKYVNKFYQAGYDVVSFGPLVGIDVDVAEYLNFNVEGRFVGETAITCGATLKY